MLGAMTVYFFVLCILLFMNYIIHSFIMINATKQELFKTFCCIRLMLNLIMKMFVVV
jgi:hypothetical protein